MTSLNCGRPQGNEWTETWWEQEKPEEVPVLSVLMFCLWLDQRWRRFWCKFTYHKARHEPTRCLLCYSSCERVSSLCRLIKFKCSSKEATIIFHRIAFLILLSLCFITTNVNLMFSLIDQMKICIHFLSICLLFKINMKLYANQHPEQYCRAAH